MLKFGAKGCCRSSLIGDEDNAVLQFGVILDPLSDPAQSWSAILNVSGRVSSAGKVQADSIVLVAVRDVQRVYQALPESPNA